MDQHPIPQDVTGFQFKLIGTMTVKQFGYVAVGAVLAVILYYLPINSPLGILLKVFLIPALGASGVIIAFVPVDGRPIDVMATNFAKALFSPNQYIYKRQGRKMSFSVVNVVKPTAAQTAAQGTAQASKPMSQSDDKQAKLQAFLINSQGGVKNELDKKEASFLNAFTPVLPTAGVVATPSPTLAAPTQTPIQAGPKFVTPKPAMTSIPMAQPNIAVPNVTPNTTSAQTTPQTATPIQAQPATPAPVQPIQAAPVVPAQKETPETLSQKELQLEQALAQAKQEEAKPLPQAAHEAAHVKVETVTKQIEEIHAQKMQLEQELAKLKTQLSEQKAPATAQVIPAPVQTPQSAIPVQDPHFIKIVPKAEADKRTDVPRVSDTPNVVVGIVKDPRGNVLSNILVEVKDKSGNPVRAFKTNPLGQFASATPLSPGVYTIELEDPKGQNNFDVIQITANNEIMRPIEIISHDAREALRQQLFN